MTDFLKASSIGRKVERIRKLKGIKQEVLGRMIGMSAQTISRLEQSDHIDDEKLEEIAKALGLSADDIRNFDEEALFNNFVSGNGTVFNLVENYHFNPIEKIVELYERMLNLEREKIEMLQNQLKDKKAS